MKLKNLSIATALLLALTGCGSSGGGNSDNRPTTPNNEIKNNQTTQNQANAQQAELDRLKSQLSQAQNEKQMAEDKLKQAEQLSAQDLNKAKADLHKAQEELAAAQKALDEKLSLEKTLTRDEVFQFALHNGLNTVDSSEFADNFKNNSKSFVTEQLVEVHKIIALKRLARSYNLSEDEVRNFVNANKDKTLNEASTLLNDKRKERENLINELTALAKQKGLEEWEARNFAYGKNYTDKESAVEDLNNYIAEKAKRKTKIDELINLAKEKGLKDWEAQNFANANLDNDRSTVQQNLEQFIVDRAIPEADEIKRRIGEDIPQGFTTKYHEKTKSIYNQQAQEIGKKTQYKDIYNQKYSIVVARYETYEEFQSPESAKKDYLLTIQHINGLFGGSETKVLPTEGSATYKGVGFTVERQGNLIYTVDFAKKEGEGKITGLKDLGTLHLDKGNIVRPFNSDDWGLGVNSSITAEEWQDQNVQGQYQLFFYGPNAEEIAGVGALVQKPSDNTTKKLSGLLPTTGYTYGRSENLLKDLPDVYPNDPSGQFGIDIGFGGTRGEIQK